MKHMKTIMPVYSGDVSGVPSALYELGGMVIMHDASGCNSTYNTHDELRWYDRESYIYISGMTEIDAVMGNDRKLIAEIVEAAEQLHPNFIAIAGTPIPYLNGTDFKAIAVKLERQTGIPSFFVPTNGTHTYVQGAGNAFYEFAKKLIPPCHEKMKSEKIRVNVLGVTPLDFALSGYEKSVKNWLEENGMHLQSCFSMNTSFSQLMEASSGDVNLVVSSSGLKVAQFFYERDGIPHVLGAPVGIFSEKIREAIFKARETRKNQVAYKDRICDSKANICIAGEPVISESIAAAVSILYKEPVRVLSPVEISKGILLEGDADAQEEEDMISYLSQAQIVIADRLLQVLVPAGCQFIKLPHVGCSGRIDADKMPDLLNILWSKKKNKEDALWD